MQKEYRLKNKREFAIVYKYGKSVANHQFVLYFLKQTKSEHFRLGISTSKKIGNAVIRNRMRRIVKEIFKNNKENQFQTYDYIVIVRRPAVDRSYSELEKSIFHLFRKAKLLNLVQ